MLLADKVVVVSGIGPGLGLKVAVCAAVEGARGVVVSARRAEGLDDVEQAIGETGSKCEVLKQVNDIRDEAACARLVAAAAARFGRIDALVNNAVAHGSDLVMSADLDSWRDTYETNVIGTLKMSRAAVEQMRTQDGGGAIVNVNTMGSRTVSPIPHSAYSTSKAALAYATKQLATEVGKLGIRVNSIHPGWMWGPTSWRYLRRNLDEWGGSEEEGYARVNAKVALPRAATDDEVARASLFLVSDYAAAITGASLDANAGEYMP
jgi:NAD(P)-dependent dehydrogenase (short-subunit alcohol dehydrogenase family)